MARDNAEALNRFLDDLSHGPAIPDDDVDPDLIATVRWFGDFGAQPRPDPDFRNRLEHDLMNQLALAPVTGLPASGPTHVLPSADKRRLNWSVTHLPTQLPQGFWAHARLAAVLVLALLGLAYLALGPLRPDPERPRQIPAAVGPTATPSLAEPTATPVPTMVPPTTLPPTVAPVPPTVTPPPSAAGVHPVAGAWHWAHADPDNIVVFNADGTYLEYSPDFGVGLGGWRQTGERTAELVVVFQVPSEPLAREEVFAPDYVSTGQAFQPGTVIQRFTIEVDASGTTMIAIGTYEERDATGTVVSAADIDPQFGTRVGGGIPPGATGVAGILLIQVVGEDGMTPIGGTCLELIGASTASVCDDGEGDVDPNPGIIELDGLPDGEYTVAVLPPEGFEPSGDWGTLVVLPGQVSTLYITLHPTGGVMVEPTVAMPPSEGGIVAIQVVAEDGVTPIGGACVAVIGDYATHVCDDSVDDLDPTPGWIELDGLPGGSYVIAVVAPPAGYEAPAETTLDITPADASIVTIVLRRIGGDVVGPPPTVAPPMPTVTPVT